GAAGQVVWGGAILIAWEAAGGWGLLDRVFVPAPSSILQVLAVTGAEALPRLGETLLKTLLGYALAILAGVPAGLVLGSRPTAHPLALPHVGALHGVPEIPGLPRMALIFGIGLSTDAALGAGVA